MTTDFYHTGIELPMRRTVEPKQNQVPLSEQLLAIYMHLLNLGVDAVKDRRQIKYIKICNFVAMTSFLASLVYIVLSVLWSNAMWFIAVNSLCITSVGVLYLNKTGRVNVSRIFYLLAVDTLLYFIALIVGPYAHGENFLLVAVLIPFLMYDIDKYKMVIAGITIPVILLMSYQSVEPLFAQYHVSIAHQNILRNLGIPMEVGLAIAAVFQFVYYSRKTEIELESTNHKLTLHMTELKRSNADLEAFAYVISHDLKTPIRNISGFMKLLANKHAISLDGEATEFVDFAVKSAKRMERLIDDVLAYSRIGRNLSPPSPVNINDVINTIRYELNGKPEMLNATISIDRELPTIGSVHSSLIYHIFQNLTRNGLKFNKSGHPEINISWTESIDYYTFSVKDNGIGISEKYMAQVFQMFKRLHNENEYDGTGIGLAICKKIVEHYNGHIWFESEEAMTPLSILQCGNSKG